MVVELLDLHSALEKDEVVPYFQPLVALRTGQVTGFEVLARWQNVVHGPILPSNFIALAEKNGLVGFLTNQILSKAFAAASALPDPLMLAVNISPTQLHFSSLPGQIRGAAETVGFPLKRVTIEITESALLGNLSRAQKIVAELKEMGCRLSLDDFGTGYSSLSHLQALPFDDLKIDRSFVSSMTTQRESRKIAAAIIGLGHSLGLITVAEGVETEDQADMLLCLGCELGQGWLYGRPVPAEALIGLTTAPLRSPHVVISGSCEWAVSSLEALPTQRLAQLQAIYDGAPVGLCFLDKNLRYISVNQKLAEMNGVSIESHLGKAVSELFPEAFKAYEPYLARALDGEAMEGIEIVQPGTSPDTPGKTIQVSYQPAWDEGAEVIGISIAVLDISEKRDTEAALRDRDSQLQHLADLNRQVPWIMDGSGDSLQVSSQWVRAPGTHRSKTRDLGWLEALHEDDLEPTLKKMREAMRTGTPIDIEYRVCVEAEWRWMRSRGSPRFGPNGEIVRWYGTVEDIDKAKRGAETA